MYAYVGAISLGRLLDGRHWTSDTMAGAIMGFAIGKALADHQERRIGSSPGTATSSSRVPSPSVQWSFRF